MRHILILSFLLLGVTGIQAQETSSTADNWWYGAHFDLGFSGGNNSSFIAVGIAPMMGYKITPEFSIGPRVEVLYNNYRFRTSFDDVESFNVVSWGIGAFSRFLIYRGFFVQGEFGYENRIDYIDIANRDVFRLTGTNASIGGGFNRPANGRLGYEVMIAYDLNLLGQPTLNLLSYRVGFTVNLN